MRIDPKHVTRVDAKCPALDTVHVSELGVLTPADLADMQLLRSFSKHTIKNNPDGSWEAFDENGKSVGFGFFV
jgi:hypothetical protein